MLAGGRCDTCVACNQLDSSCLPARLDTGVEIQQNFCALADDPCEMGQDPCTIPFRLSLHHLLMAVNSARPVSGIISGFRRLGVDKSICVHHRDGAE